MFRLEILKISCFLYEINYDATNPISEIGDNYILYQSKRMQRKISDKTTFIIITGRLPRREKNGKRKNEYVLLTEFFLINLSTLCIFRYLPYLLHLFRAIAK